MRAPAGLLVAATLAASAPAFGAGGTTLVLRYRAFDSVGRAGADSTLVLRTEGASMVGSYRPEGSGELRVELDLGGRQMRALYSGLDSGKAFSALFSAAERSIRVRSARPSADGWKPSLRDGDSSLFFILPRLLDLRAGASRTDLTVFRDDDGRRVTFTFACKGPERLDVGGESFLAYEVVMTPADFLLRLAWPYSNRYYFRVGDLVMLRFEGPDDNRRMSRLDLESMEVAE